MWCTELHDKNLITSLTRHDSVHCSFGLYALPLPCTALTVEGSNSDIISMNLYIALLWKTIFCIKSHKFSLLLKSDFKGFSAFEVKVTCKEQLCVSAMIIWKCSVQPCFFLHMLFILKNRAFVHISFLFQHPQRQCKYISVSNSISISVFLEWKLLYPIPFASQKKKLFPYKLTMLT